MSEYVSRKEFSYHEGYKAENGTVVQYQKDWTRQHQLEGDGLLSQIYEHMWKSDKTKEHHLRTACIPDTVVYLNNFPRAWYMYDMKTQEITKRPGKDLDAHSINTHFCTEVEGCDIVAQFYHKTWTQATPAAKKHQRSAPNSARSTTSASASPRGGGAGEGGRNPSSSRGAGSGSSTARSHQQQHHHHHAADEDGEEIATAVEFFTKETLYEFLHNRANKPDGVLQKFLIPKGKSSSRCNFQIQAVWSPIVTMVYKRTNMRRLNDKSVAVEERAATFDGPPHLSSESLVAKSTKKAIDSVCKAVVAHFSLTEHKPITRIVLYFKVDDKDRLWVLWASSLRIGGDKLNPSFLRVPLQLALRVNTAERDEDEIMQRSAAGSTVIVGKGGRVIGSRKEKIPPAPLNSSRGRKTMERQLLQKDIDLYEMTGDWIFAKSRCSGKYGRSHSPDHTLDKQHQAADTTPRVLRIEEKKKKQQQQEEDEGGATPRTAERADDRDTTPQTEGKDGQRKKKEDEEEGATTPAAEDDGHQEQQQQEENDAGDGDVSPSISPRRHRESIMLKEARFMAPRAPFLPTMNRHTTPRPEEGRHPLHRLYLDLQASKAEMKEKQRANAANRGRYAQYRATGGSGGAGGDGSDGSTPRRPQPPTKVQRLKQDLRTLAQDVVYSGYSSTLGTTVDGRNSVSLEVDVPRPLRIALSIDDVEELLRLMHLRLVPESLGERAANDPTDVGRGKRQDRPIGQILRDVNDFFDDAFARDEYNIMNRWKEHEEAQGAVDLSAEEKK